MEFEPINVELRQVCRKRIDRWPQNACLLACRKQHLRLWFLCQHYDEKPNGVARRCLEMLACITGNDNCGVHLTISSLRSLPRHGIYLRQGYG